MFGMGGSEILVILIVALIFLGPEKLPDAATKISKGIRELRRQTREVQQTIENDTQIGGAIRDLKHALRGEEIRPRVREALKPLDDVAKTVNDAIRPAPKVASPKTVEAAVAALAAKEAAAAGASTAEAAAPATAEAPAADNAAEAPAPATAADKAAEVAAAALAAEEAAQARAAAPARVAAEAPAAAEAEATADDADAAEPAGPRILPPSAGEPHDPDAHDDPDGDAELAKLIRPASGTVAQGPKSADG